MIKIKADESNVFGVKIKVVGVGGAGGNAVGEMVPRLSGVDLIAINTDSQALAANTAPIKLQIGRRLTEGLGTGANPEMGKFAANEDRAQIAELLKGANVVFLTLGLGGGTGTGAGPVVAKIAKDNGAVVIGFVTFPFGFEGGQRMEIAQDGLPDVRKQLDTLITVPNEKIFDVVPPDTSLKDAFSLVNDILYQGVAAISDLITQPGLMNLDFADLRTIVEDGGEGLMGTGVARGANRSEEASRLAISNPFLKREELFTARNILISIAGGENLGVFEVRKVVYYIHQALTPQAKSFCGTVIDSRLEDDLKVTVIATGLEKAIVRGESQEKEIKPPKKDRDRDKIGPSLFEGGLSESEIPAFIRNKKME